MERRGGILQLTFHTRGGSLRWGQLPHREFALAFADIGSDPDNKVVIMMGRGEEFSGPRAWDPICWKGKHLLGNLLNIGAPMISAVNGPALRHSELPLLCDIVLAAEEATF